MGAVKGSARPSQRHLPAIFAGSARAHWRLMRPVLWLAAMKRIAHPSMALTLWISLVCGACSTVTDRYPSLAIRDVERAQGEFEPVAVEPIAVPEVETGLTGPLGSRLAALVSQAREAHAEFSSSAPRTRQLVAGAAGSGVGSDAWAAAQVALADLDSARSLAAIPLGDLDILYVAATVQAEESAAIAAARAEVVALVAQEDVVLDELRARIR